MTSLTQPSPMKKKMSLTDYMANQRKAKAEAAQAQAQAQATPPPQDSSDAVVDEVHTKQEDANEEMPDVPAAEDVVEQSRIENTASS